MITEHRLKMFMKDIPAEYTQSLHKSCHVFALKVHHCLIAPGIFYASVLSHKFIELKASPIVSRIVQTIRGENDERPTKGEIDFE